MIEQLSPQDAQFVFMQDADVVANLTGAYIFDQSAAPKGVVRFKEIVAHIERRLSNCPFYRRKIVRTPLDLDFPYWVDDPHFDIENHVHHARLPKPADWRQFCIHVARYHSRPLDMGRPLWEIYILEGLDNLPGVPKGSFAMLSKVHHAAVDGTSGLQMLGALMDLTPSGPPAFIYKKRPKAAFAPTPQDALLRAARNTLVSPLRLAEAAGKASPQIARLAADMRRPASQRRAGAAPHTIFNGEVSPHKSFDAIEFPFADFKIIRAAYPEAKINDIILATVSGGVRRYLQEKSALPERSLIAMAPINARASDSAKNGAGNNISAMTTPLFTQIAHPVERLKAIVLSTRKSKAAQEGVGARLMTDLTKHAPASVLALASRFVIQNLAQEGRAMNNLIVSNVPGPQIPLYFCGAKMTSMYGLAPLGGGIGLFIATPSYDGRIIFSVTSTREIMPDTPFFMDCLKHSFEELKTAAEKRLKPRAPKAAAAGKGASKPARRRERPTAH
jgi:WS/DGAT/MGAT family acyltransferase